MKIMGKSQRKTMPFLEKGEYNCRKRSLFAFDRLAAGLELDPDNSL